MFFAGVQQFPDGGDGLLFVIEEITGDTFFNHLGDSAGAGGDDGYAGGHGFKDDEAQSFSARGHDKDVAAGVGGGEFVAVKKAGEVDGQSGEVLLQGLVVGAVADQGETGFGHGFKDGLEAFDVLLRGEAADVEEQRAFGMAVGEAGTHCVRTVGGMKAVGIDSAGPEGDACDAMLRQLIDHDDGGAEVDGGAIVAQAEQRPDDGLDESQAVVAEVFGEIGVVGDDHGQAKRAAVAAAAVVESGDAEERGLGDMEDVRLEVEDDLAHGSARKRKAEFRIEGKRVAGDAEDAALREFVEAACGRDDQDFVAEGFELLDGLAEGGDDSIDFGNKCFSEENNSHGPCQALTFNGM